MKIQKLSGVLLCFATLFLISRCQADTITWTNTSGGNWSVAANWSPNEVPGPADDARITASGTYLVTLDTNPTINSLTLGAVSGEQTLTNGNFTLTLNDTSTIGANGIFDVSEGSFGGSGNLGVQGVFNWSGGQLNGGASLTVASNGVLDITGSLNIFGALTNEGTANWQAGSLLVAGLIWNETNALWDIQCDQTVNNDGNGEFYNMGLLQKDTTTGTTSFNVYLANSGGTVHAESGTIDFNGGSDLGGIFEADASAAIYFGGGNMTLSSPPNFQGPGPVQLTGASFTLSNFVGTLALDGSSLTGQSTIAAGGTVSMTGQLNGGASLTVASNGVLDITGSLNIFGALTNEGTANWQAGSLLVAGLIWNETNALWDIQCDQTVNNDGNGEFYNMGLLQKDTTTGTTSFNVYVNNCATIEANLGTISLQGGYTNSPSANLAISLGGTTPDSGYGNISFSTPLAASGTLTINTSNGFQPSPGEAFAVLSYPALTGTFTNFSSPAGAIWQTNYNATSLILTNVGQINWTTPSNITYGAALGASQLNASTTPDVAGAFAYNPAAGTVLDSGIGQWLTTTFTPSIPGDASASLQVPITVLPAPLSITATNQTKIYGQTFNFAGTEFVTSGLVNGDTVTSASLASDGTPPTAPVSGSPYKITASNAQGDAGLTNYLITYVDGELTVNPAALTITANSTSKTYGQNLTFAETAFVSSPLQNSETIGTVTLTSAGAISNAPVSGSPYSIVPSAATGGTFIPGNYAITYDLGTLTVNRAGLTVTANSTARYYGAANPIFSASYSGLVNNETVSVISGAPGFSTPAILTSGVGSYAITPSLGSLTAANYTFGPFNNGTLTINPAALSITASNLSKTYGQMVTFAGTEFAANGLLNSDTVTLATLTSAGAISNAPVSGSPYSIVPSAATGSGLANYTITYNNGELTVNKASLGITANSTSKTYGQNLTFAGTEFVSTPLQNAETIGTVTLTSAGAISNAPVSGSPYSIVPSAATGGTFTPGNYAITYTNGTLTVNRAGLAVTANNAERNYGVANPAFSASYSGLVNNETASVISGAPNLSTPATVTSGVGGYAITPSLGTLSAANYSFGPFNNGTLTINAAALSITATNQTKTYGQNLTFAGTEFSTIGLVNGDTVTSASLASAGAISNAPVSGSPYVITIANALGDAGLTNYVISYTNGHLTVNPALLGITANSTSKTYGQNLTFAGTEFVFSGLQNLETIDSVTLASAGAISNAPVSGSPYSIVPSAATGGTFAPGNYAINYTNGALTVNRASLTITANSTNKIKGETLTFAGTEFTASGLQNLETIGSVTLTSAGAAAPAAAGSYNIIPSAPVGGTFSPGNYSDIFVDGTLIVSGQPGLMLSLIDGQYVLTFQTVPGQMYQPEYSTNLTVAGWTPLGEPVTGTGGAVNVTNTIIAPQVFFQLQIAP